jgi:hypothetical protein
MTMNEKQSAVKVQSMWRGQQTRSFIRSANNLMPVLIIPAIAGSGLRIEASALDEKYVGERVWMNAGMLAMSRLYRPSWNLQDVVQAKKYRSSLTRQPTFVEREAEANVKSAWLHHMSLSSDMVSERKGNRVRPFPGLEGVEYMSDSAITRTGSWVHAPVAKTLLKLGYMKGKNLDAAPYDWRLPPSITEERDQYLTRTKQQIERMYNDNFRRPVILLCHSMGCKMGHYFLNWVLQKYGQGWLDKYIHSYMPIGAPHCGVPLAVKAGLVGEGLSPEVDFLLANDSEGLILYRSWGSGGWLMPRILPKHIVPSVIRRREGELALCVVGPIPFGTLFRDRIKPPTEVRLGVKLVLPGYSQPVVAHSLYIPIPRNATELKVQESFYFALPNVDEDQVFCELSCFLEEPTMKVQSDSQARRVMNRVTQPIRRIKKSLSAMSREIAKAFGMGVRVGVSFPNTLRPCDFDKNQRKTMEVSLQTGPNTLFSKCSTTVQFKLKYQSADSMAPNDTDTPIAAIETPTDQIPIVHTNQDTVQYDALSGHQLFEMEGFIKMDDVIRKFYEEDPVGPRTMDPPPVKRVNAIYGINLPTEVSAVYRHRPAIVVGDDEANSRYILDTECQLDSTDKNCSFPWNWKDLEIEGGTVKETKNTMQTTLNEKGVPIEIPCCGDGTVPYWNLAHCKTWRPYLEELTVDELEGAGHRGILADTRFHELLKKYCVVQNQRTVALLKSYRYAGKATINLFSSEKC